MLCLDYGVEWTGAPEAAKYIDLNGLYFWFSNPIGLIVGSGGIGFGTYSITGTSGTLHCVAFKLAFFLPS